MLDTVDKFETIRDGDLIVRLHPDEAAVMREQVVPWARQALDTLSKQYQFKPTGPILVEMFPKHDDFAVRTIGLPGFLYALGACFGRVVTLDSPRARPPGTFSWAGTLWHEMAHVISLQMSNNRVPRWISEGISQFEERRARPEWGRESELPFVQALDAGKLLKLADIAEGLSDPQLASIAYQHASLVVEHLIDTYGEPALWRMLRAFGKGLETDAAFKEAFNVTLDDLQVSFDAAMKKKYAGMSAALKRPELPEKPTLDQLKQLATDNPGSFAVQMRLGQALYEAGNAAEAIAALERASKLLPEANGDANPNAMIAQIATKQGDTARAIRALEAVVKVDSADVESARTLAQLLAKQQRRRRAPPPPTPSSPSSIRSTCRRRPSSAATRCSRRTRRARSVRSGRRWPRALPTGQPPTWNWPKRTSWRASSATPSAKRWRRSKSRRRSSARRTCS